MERRNSGVFLLLLYVALAVYLLPLFPNEGSANDLTRWATTVSLVEKNSFDISWTQDIVKTEFSDVTKLTDGSVYSNKSPGVAFLSAPFYALIKVIIGKPTPENMRTSWLILRLVIASLPLLILGIWLLGMEVDAFSLGVLLFATPLFPYSLLYYSHVLVAVLVYFAFRLIYDTRRVFPERCFWAGGLVGFAFFCEYSALIPLAIFGIGLLSTESRERSRRMLFYIAGIAPFLFGMALYNQLVFGSPVAMISQYELTYPTLNGVYEFLLSPSRGILFFSPILLFSFFAIFDSDDRGFRRHRIKLATVLFTFLAVVGFTEKYGGDAIGARHLIVVIPLMLDSFFDGEIEDYSSLWRGFLFTVSFLFCTIPMLTFPFVSTGLKFPHNSFWQTLLYDVNFFVPTLVNDFGVINSIWTILPVFALLLIGIYLVWRDAKFPFRFAVGILAGFLLVGNYMFLADLEPKEAQPMIKEVTKLKNPIS